MLPFQLTSLGPPELRGPDGDPVRFRTRKHFALLIYLAIEPPIPHRRDRLATFFWPDAHLDEARHSLATGLSMIRARLGPDAFDAGRDTVRLVSGRVVSDLPGLMHEDPDGIDVPSFRPFLEEFELIDVPEFQQWKDGQQAHLLPLLHRGLARRIDDCRRRGDSRQLEMLGERLQRIDPLSEEALQALLESRAMAGDRIGALRLFDRWRARLADELGAEPGPQLQRMADRLRRGRWEGGAPSAPAAPVPTEQWKERVFIGRGEEFSTCYAIWERARTGTPRHVLLRGESGIGKTTLVERFTTAVALEGASVARVQCYMLERELPFGVIGSLVTQLLDLPGASATPPPQLAELARLIAKVRQRYPSLPAPLQTEGESARIMFAEGVMALVAALAEEHPVVLVIDDIHLADATSLAVLHLMLRRIEDLPLMVMLTSSSALEVETPDARRFADNAKSIGLTRMALGPLPDGEATALLDAQLTTGESMGPAIHRAILAGARGNPMVLELLVEDWRRLGDGCLAIALGSMASRSDRPPKEAFRRLVEGNLSLLDAEARSVAELAALLGVRLNDLSMYNLVDLPVARTMRAMTALTAHRIFRDAGNHLEFANEFVRGQCYMAIAAPLRRMLHGLVADRLLAQDGAAEPIPGLEIAWHLVRADRLAEAIPYLLAGGRESIRRGAPHEADLALSTGLPALTGAARRTTILLLAEARQELGRWEDSLRVLDLGEEPFTESEACEREVMRIVARRWLGHLTVEGISSSTVSLLEMIEKNIDIEVKVKVLSAIVRMHGLTWNSEHLRLLEAAIPHVARFPMDSYQRLHLILATAWVLGAQRKTQSALTEISKGVELAIEAEIASSIAVRLLLGKGNLLYLLGDYQGALPPLLLAERMAKRLDNGTLRGECATKLALVEGRLGRVNAQIDWARQALEFFPPTDWSAGAIGAAYELGLGLTNEGRHAEARSAIADTLEQRRKGLPEWARQASLLCAADVLLFSGHEQRAYTLARRGTEGNLKSLKHEAYAGQFARWVALIGIKCDEASLSLERLRISFPDPAILDLKDQAEVLGAIALLESTVTGRISTTWKKVQYQLTKLPPSIAAIMRRSGIASER